jgi:hypothetical protein
LYDSILYRKPVALGPIRASPPATKISVHTPYPKVWDMGDCFDLHRKFVQNHGEKVAFHVLGMVEILAHTKIFWAGFLFMPYSLGKNSEHPEPVKLNRSAATVGSKPPACSSSWQKHTTNTGL